MTLENRANPINVSELRSESAVLISTEQGLHGLIDLFKQHTAFEPVRYQNGTTISVPTELGSGHLSWTKLPDGVQFALFHLRFNYNTRLRFQQNDRREVLLHTLLSGSHCYKVREQSIRQSMDAGAFLCHRDTQGTLELEVTAHVPVVFAQIWCPESYFTLPPEAAPPTTQWDAGRISEDLFVTGTASTGALRSLRSVMNLRGGGGARHLKLYAEVYRLLADFVQQIERKARKTTERNALLTYRDIEQILRARELLTGQLRDAPSIPVLAKQVGMNRQKLKVGFKQLFGTTISRYLRRCRLERARRLIEQGNLNLREITTQVGYTNQSHFASRFREQYGMLPREYLKQHKGL